MIEKMNISKYLEKINFINLGLSVAIILSFYILYIILNKFIKKKIKGDKFRIPLILILVSLSIMIFFRMNFTITSKFRFVAAIILVIAVFSAIKIMDYLSKDFYEDKIKIKVPSLIHNIFVGIIYFIAFFTILKIQLGIDLTPVLTTSAVVSMVIGLALQSTLTNFIAGIVIHVEKPFKNGDWVLVNKTEGRVVGVNWRTTKILTFDNDFLVIPNGSIIGGPIINFNYPTSNHVLSRIIGLSYDVPPNKVKKVILEAVSTIPNILSVPSPEVRLNNYNDFSIDYELRIWVNDYGQKKRIENDIMSNLWYVLKREDINIPYPIRDVYHHGVSKVKIEKEDDLENFKIMCNIEFFENLKEEDLQEIYSKVIKKVYGKGEVIFSKDSEGESFFIICSGEVVIEVEDNEVVRLKKGDYFGEMSLFTGKKRNATARVLEDVEVLILNKDNFAEIIKDDLEIAEKISEIIARREINNREIINNNNKVSQKSVNEIKRFKQKNILSKIKKFFNI